jgi:hypothetical protein
LSFFERAPGLYEACGRNAKGLGNGKQVGFVRLQEPDEGRKKGWVAHPIPKLVCANSGQVEEAPGPPLVPKRCRKCGEGKNLRIIWSIGEQGLGSRT